MSALDIIELPGEPGKYGRRALVEAWIAAGSPPVNYKGAGRLHADQKYFYDGWAARLPGFNPADNPDDESQRLAHVRFGALDITPTPDRVRRLTNAGLIRPYSYEPHHFELPNIRSYPIVRALPAPAAEADPITLLGDPMSLRIIDSPSYRNAHQVVIHNGMQTMAVPDGWTQRLIQFGRVEHIQYDTDNDLITEQNLVLQLGGFSADKAAAKTAEMIKNLQEGTPA